MKFHLRDLFWLILVAAFCTLWLRDRYQLNKLAEAQARAAAAERQVLQFMLQSQVQNFGPPSPNPPPNFAPNFVPAPPPVLSTELPASGAGEDGENSDKKSLPNSPREADESATESNSKLGQTSVPKRGENATSKSAAANLRMCVFPGENSQRNRT
jgi:hypothetical protein